MLSWESENMILDCFNDTKNLEICDAITKAVKEIDEWYSLNHEVAGNFILKTINNK